MSSVVKLLFPIYLKILETRGTRDKEWKTQRRVDYLCQISQTELWQRVANFPDQNLAPEEAFAQIAKKEPYTMSNIVPKTLRKKKITLKWAQIRWKYSNMVAWVLYEKKYIEINTNTVENTATWWPGSCMGRIAVAGIEGK